MLPDHTGDTNVVRPPAFAAGRTGALALAIAIYVPVAVLVNAADPGGIRALEIFRLYSDTPACLATVALFLMAAGRASDDAVRRTWRLLAAALGVYSIGNLLNSTYWLFGRDPFPSVGDLFFLAFYPLLFAAVFAMIRAAALRVPWGRLTLDGAILVLGFGAFFWFSVVHPAAEGGDVDVVKYVLTQVYVALNCLMVMAFGILLIAGTGDLIRRRTLVLLTLGFATMFLADIVWAMSKVAGQYIPGGISDAVYLFCYAMLAAAAREQLRGPAQDTAEPSALDDLVVQGLPYAAMAISFLVLVSFTPGDVNEPATIMTVVIFAITMLLMVRQGLAFRDDALVREARAARLVEARYASLIRNASDVILIVGVDGHLRFASPAAERAFALRPDELVGRNLLELWEGADRDRLSGFLAEVAANHGKAVGPVEMQVTSGTKCLTLESVGTNLLHDPAVAGLALNFRDVSERKALEDQLRQLALHDALTLLANRSLFRNRVEHALALTQRSGQPVVVMLLDIDNFKTVNETLGHNVGDRLLRTVAQRLVKCTRAADTVARLGGDEFAILLEGINDADAIERVAANIMASLAEPLVLDGTSVRVAASIGVVFSRPDYSAEELLRNADIAMYSAKAAGKGRHAVFHPQMQEVLRERQQLEEAIGQGLAREEFFLEFQPVVDLRNRFLLGVEALVRWRHPEQGVILPGRFVPVAEDSGQIIALGRWVLIEACCRMRSWRESIASGQGLSVAVNISGRHLQEGDLPGDVARALKVSGLDPGSLVIELTEGTIMQDTEANLARLQKLKALGVRIAIDDFGTGYSSLSYLHRFPIDILKIDRSFISRLAETGEGPELARAVVILGDSVGLETVAEGIEQEDQVTALLALGCAAGQGFLFSPSTTLEALASSPFVARREQLLREQPGVEAQSRASAHPRSAA